MQFADRRATAAARLRRGVRPRQLVAAAHSRAARRPRRRTASRAICGRRWPSSAGSASSSRRRTAGSASGYKELALVLEELGKGLMPEPLLSTRAARRQRDPARRQRRAARGRPAGDLIGGELLLALRLPGARRAATTSRHVATRAERAGDGWRLTRREVAWCSTATSPTAWSSARAPPAASATAMASPSSCVERAAPGVDVTRQWTLDSRNAAFVRLDGVAVDAGRRARRGRRRRRHCSPTSSTAPPSVSAPRCSAAWRRRSR